MCHWLRDITLSSNDGRLYNVFISDTSNPPSRSSAPITVSNYTQRELQNYTAIWMVPDDDNVEDSEDDTQSQSTGINVSVIQYG